MYGANNFNQNFRFGRIFILTFRPTDNVYRAPSVCNSPAPLDISFGW